MEVNVEAGCSSMINSSSDAEISEIPKENASDALALTKCIDFKFCL